MMAALLKLLLLLGLACSVSAQERTKIEHDIVNPYICTPGTSFKVDCNYCHCRVDGRVDCTLMACSVGPDDCIPGTVFSVGEDFCRCPDCGYKWHSDCFASNYCQR